MLAAALREHREQILTDWLATLRVGMEKPGAVLDDVQLRDHLADLLEDLCHQLEVPLTEASEISALRHAEVHGDMRWMQGYKLPELIREVAALRTVVIAAVVAHGHTRLDLRQQSFANIGQRPLPLFQQECLQRSSPLIPAIAASIRGSAKTLG